MNLEKSTYDRYLRNAYLSLKQGDKSSARIWGMKAANVNPDREEAWLVLAAVAAPRASVNYLKRALEINPGSIHARKGMHWAIQRLRSENSSQDTIQIPVATSNIKISPVKKQSNPSIFAWLFILMIIPGFLMTW